MSRKIKWGVSALLASTIFLGSFSQGYANYYNNEIDKLNSKINSIEKKALDYKNNRDSLDYDKELIIRELSRIKKMINKAEKRINLKEVEMNEVNNNLLKIYKEIRILENELREREASFRDRVQSIHKGDKLTFLDVVVSSKSVGDLISRVFSYQTIVKADNKAIEEYLNLTEQLNNKKVMSENLLKELESHVKELEQMKIKLMEDKEKNNQLKLEKERQSKNIESVIKDLLKERSDLINKRSSLETEKSNYSRLWKSDYIDIDDYLGKDDDIQDEISDGKMFVTPAKGSFTSGFGPRWGTIHYGIDIANKVGTSVLSSADGEVTYSGVMNGYGNVIMIKHEIEGVVYMTVYAHLHALGVRPGDIVEQGQVIGLMGSTGKSYGPHLHFEVHVNGVWNNSKSNAKDPLEYLKKKISDNYKD